jgi:hypothetical protein
VAEGWVIETVDLKKRIEQHGVPGSFSGTLNADGTELSGTFTQRGITAKLTFKRVSQ